MDKLTEMLEEAILNSKKEKKCQLAVESSFPTFLQLDVEPATFALGVGGVGGVRADPALQGGGGGRRGPGDQTVG